MWKDGSRTYYDDGTYEDNYDGWDDWPDEWELEEQEIEELSKKDPSMRYWQDGRSYHDPITRRHLVYLILGAIYLVIGLIIRYFF